MEVDITKHLNVCSFTFDICIEKIALLPPFMRKIKIDELCIAHPNKSRQAIAAKVREAVLVNYDKNMSKHRLNILKLTSDEQHREIMIKEYAKFYKVSADDFRYRLMQAQEGLKP